MSVSAPSNKSDFALVGAAVSAADKPKKGKKAKANKAQASSYTQGATSAAQRAAASTVDPMSLIKRVRNGEVNFSLPLKPGKLGNFTIKDGTTMSFKAVVKNGKVDMKSVKVDFSPDLDGPAWANARGAKINDGRLTLDIKMAPDMQIGPKLPDRIPDLIATLQGVVNEGSTEVRMWGGKVAKAGLRGDHLEPSGSGWLGLVASLPAYAVDKVITHDVRGKELKGNPVDLEKIKFDLKGVELEPGPLPIGPAGTVDLKAGSRVDISGTPTDVRMRGHVNVGNVNVDTHGITLRSGAGSTDLDLHMTRPSWGHTATVTADLSNLDVSTKYAATRRSNGDYVQLGEGRIDNGRVRLTEQVTFDDKAKVKSIKHHLDSLSLERFDGTITGGQLTFKDDKDTATVVLGSSRVNGNLRMTPDELAVTGMIDGRATVKDFQAGKGVAKVDVRSAQLRGAGQVSYSTKNGVSVQNGNVDMTTVLNGARVGGKVPVIGTVEATAGGDTKIDAKVRGVSFSQKNGLTGLTGVGVQFDGHNLTGKAGPVSVNGNVKTGGSIGQVGSIDAQMQLFQQELQQAGFFDSTGALSGNQPMFAQLYQQQLLIGLMAQAGMLSMPLLGQQFLMG